MSRSSAANDRGLGGSVPLAAPSNWRVARSPFETTSLNTLIEEGNVYGSVRDTVTACAARLNPQFS